MWTIYVFILISMLYIIPLFVNKKWPRTLLVYWLLGMVAPLFFVLAKPGALLISTMPTTVARRVVRFFKMPYIRLIGHPITAALLNDG